MCTSSYPIATSPRAIFTGDTSSAPKKRGRSRQLSKSDSSDSDQSRVAANSKKGKEARSINNYKDCEPTVYALIRQKNWYLRPREDLDDQPWYNWEQACIYKDIYATMKYPMRPMNAIDLNKLEKKKKFVKYMQVVKDMGLQHLMELQCDYNPELILQFFASLVIESDDAKTMKWMTAGIECESDFHKFGTVLGYIFYPDGSSSSVHRVYSADQPNKRRSWD